MLESEVNRIYREQARIRQNMGALETGSELYARYEKQLGDQEDRLAELQEQISALSVREQQQRAAIDAFIAGISIEN